MTWWELLQTEKHAVSHEIVRDIDCPADMAHEDYCPKEAEGATLATSCTICWNRQVPEGWTGHAAALTTPVDWPEEEEDEA